MNNNLFKHYRLNDKHIDDSLIKKINVNSGEYMIDIIISIIMGIVLGSILYKCYICPPIIRGPNSRDIIDKIFEVNGKYYELDPQVCGCLK